MKRRIPLVLATALILPFGSPATVNATEPKLEFWDTTNLPETLQKGVHKMKCSITWDPTSKLTEIATRCNKANHEVYVHGNATPLAGDPSQYSAGAISYLSFTLKGVAAYSSINVYASICAGAVNGVNVETQNELVSTIAWIKKSLKGVSSNKKISKMINGHDVSIIGGAGAIRTLTCGAKPKN